MEFPAPQGDHMRGQKKISVFFYFENSYTVLPRFTRLPWHIKNRVNQNSRYTSHSMDKIIVKKCQKNFYKALL